MGREDPQENEVATPSSILPWEIPWTEEAGRLQSMGSQRVRHNLATKRQHKVLGTKLGDLHVQPWLIFAIIHTILNSIITTCIHCFMWETQCVEDAEKFSLLCFSHTGLCFPKTASSLFPTSGSLHRLFLLSQPRTLPRSSPGFTSYLSGLCSNATFSKEASLIFPHEIDPDLLFSHLLFSVSLVSLSFFIAFNSTQNYTKDLFITWWVKQGLFHTYTESPGSWREPGT